MICWRAQGWGREVGCLCCSFWDMLCQKWVVMSQNCCSQQFWITHCVTVHFPFLLWKFPTSSPPWNAPTKKTLPTHARRNPFRFAFRCVSACIKELRRAWETQRFRAKGVPKISSPNFLPQKEANKNDQPNKNTQILSHFFPEKGPTSPQGNP